MEGGCLCGAVRFSLASAPFDAGWCHCRICQLNSGSPAMVFAAVLVGDYRFEQGEDRVATIKSSDFGHRAFCRDCGTPLYMRVDYEPETLDFSVATLDRPEAVVPQFHIFYASRIGWAEPADRLSRHPRSRPGHGGPA
ncbi:MAG: GFA family protein [Novosphingobium sp.]|nr:GFA family protein [Novosphingobium sp.]